MGGQGQGEKGHKTWAAGEIMAEDGNGQAVQAHIHRTPTVTPANRDQQQQQQQQQQPSTASRIKIANANAARNLAVDRNSGGGAENKAPNMRNLVVNKKIYARLDMIGKGGSSRVYRVMNSANEIYAIKRVSLDKTDSETMSGYMNEIALLKRLKGNSRIIRLVDAEMKGEGPRFDKGYLMLVMECGEIGASINQFLLRLPWLRD